MRNGERWPDDGSPGTGEGAVLSLASWPDVDLSSVSPVRLLGLVSAVNSKTADDQESLGAVAACEQVLRYVTALQLRLIHRAVTAGGPQEDPRSTFDVVSGIDLVGAELAPLFGLSKRSAQNKVWRACDLVTDLPKLVDLIEAGSLDLQRAAAADDVMREVLDPEDEAWDKVHRAIAERAPNCSNRWLRELTRRAIHNADPTAAARRHQQAAADRRVGLDPLPHAMASVTAILPADEAQLVDTVLNALADGCRDHSRAAGTPDPRSHDQRRADAFVALFRSVAAGNPLPVMPVGDPLLNAGTSGASGASGASVGDDRSHFEGRFEAPSSRPTDGLHLPGIVAWWCPPLVPQQQGRRPQITVTMPLSTLTGLDDQAADLAGYGPIPAELARAIAAEAAHYRVIPVPDDSASATLGAKEARPRPTSPAPAGAPEAPATTAATPATTARKPPAAARNTRRPPSPPGARMSKSDPSGDASTTAFHGPGDVARCTPKDQSYRPGQSLVDWVVAYHQECRHPNCERPARVCDIDHVVEYPEGPTCRCKQVPSEPALISPGRTISG